MNHQEAKSVLNKTTKHISESEYVIYMYHVAKNLHKEAVPDRIKAANK